MNIRRLKKLKKDEETKKSKKTKEPKEPKEAKENGDGIVELKLDCGEVVRLKLAKGIGGDVDLVVVDEDGKRRERGYLLGIKSSGIATVYDGVDSKFGLVLNRHNRLTLL